MTRMDGETIVAFDVDKTLTVRDCVVPFLSLVAGKYFFVRVVLSNPLQLISLLGHRDRDGLKKLFLKAAFSGRRADQVDILGGQFAQTVLHKWIRADVAQRLRWHQQKGHRVLLVSASLDSYLKPLAEAIGAEALLCTTLEVDKNGILSGNMVGNNCRAAEKVTRLKNWAMEQGIDGDGWLAVGYGDSHGDAEMLAFSRIGCNVSKQILEPSC